MGRAHDTAPVLVPIISTVDAVSGLVIASGFSGHGVGIGPGSGLLTSQLATGETPWSIGARIDLLASVTGQ